MLQARARLEAARLWMQLQGRPVMLQAALEAARLWMQLPHQGLRVRAVSVEADVRLLRRRFAMPRLTALPRLRDEKHGCGLFPQVFRNKQENTSIGVRAGAAQCYFFFRHLGSFSTGDDIPVALSEAGMASLDEADRDASAYDARRERGRMRGIM